ncbi:hypothetical protein RQP46_000379 [Phenoliferia psychrophenolica]
MNRLSRSAIPILRAQSAARTPLGISPAAWQPEPSTSRFPTSFVRSISPFSTSAPSFASEAPQSPFEAPYSQAAAPLYDRLHSNPETLEAIKRLSLVLKEKTGVDLAGGEKPTMAMMMKLAQDPDLRAAAENLMKALSEAGIQIDPQQALQALKTMGDGEFDGLGVDPDLPAKKAKGEGEGDGKA